MEVGWQRYDPAPLTPPPGKKLGTHCTGGCVGPQGRYGRVRGTSLSTGFDLRTVQPVASRYTDWAIPARPGPAQSTT